MDFNLGNDEDIRGDIQLLDHKILKRKIRRAEQNDKLRWGLNGNGNFSLKKPGV